MTSRLIGQVFAIGILGTFCQPVCAQHASPSHDVPEPVSFLAGELQAHSFCLDDSIAGTTAVSRTPKSPATAMLLSAVLPGAGQFYNESYWKVPVVLGLGTYFISELLHNNRLYLDFRDRYTTSLQAIPGGDPQMLRLREFYKDQRNTFGWYFLILYVANLVDAYVDAVLFDFEIGDSLAVHHPLRGDLPQVKTVMLTVRIQL